MTIDKNAPCSDLDAARRTSSRLRGTPGTPAARNQSPFGYTPFTLARVTTNRSSSTDAARRWGSTMWNELLDRCIEVSHASSAFLTDERGLVLTARGTESSDRVEVLGARLVVAVEQASRLVEEPGEALTVAVEVGRSWVTGIQVMTPDRTSLLIGLLGEEPVSGSARDAVVRFGLHALRMA